MNTFPFVGGSPPGFPGAGPIQGIVRPTGPLHPYAPGANIGLLAEALEVEGRGAGNTGRSQTGTPQGGRGGAAGAAGATSMGLRAGENPVPGGIVCAPPGWYYKWSIRRTVYICGIDQCVTEGELTAVFLGYGGNLLDVRMCEDPNPQCVSYSLSLRTRVRCGLR